MAVCCNHGIILKSFQIPRNLLCTVNRWGCLHAHTCTKRHNYRTNMSMHMYSQTHSFARSFPCAGCWLMMSVHVHDCLFELLIWSWYCLVFGLNIEKKRLIMYSFIMKTCFLSMADIFLQNPSDCKIHCFSSAFAQSLDRPPPHLTPDHLLTLHNSTCFFQFCNYSYKLSTSHLKLSLLMMKALRRPQQKEEKTIRHALNC